jgi:hypothetical protein
MPFLGTESLESFITADKGTRRIEPHSVRDNVPKHGLLPTDHYLLIGILIEMASWTCCANVAI